MQRIIQLKDFMSHLHIVVIDQCLLILLRTHDSKVWRENMENLVLYQAEVFVKRLN